ncbi:hypothetical protein [Evansella clarkii]|jgi:hypothetical protein|uniref:hypothetical protein n=1 Tax=Evansella clarkii TaxID=79879 RepID=UPI000995F05F|nr:hypothetical protein [Evansella clarkii]
MAERTGKGKNIAPEEKEKLREELEQKIIAALWLQVVGQFAEAYYSAQLFALDDESEGEQKISLGQWVQVIGQSLEALGATKQHAAVDPQLLIAAQKLAVNGNALQSLGSAIETIGGKEVILEELLFNVERFVP